MRACELSVKQPLERWEGAPGGPVETLVPDPSTDE